MSYYNTTLEGPVELRRSRAKAGAQDEVILSYFKDHPGDRYSPDEIHRNLFTVSVPITSVRRSINTLTKAGYLTKTLHMKMGSYGKMTHTWELTKGNNNQLKLIN